MDVAIVGVGLHPFGRFDISAREMALVASRGALADANVEWADIDFAAGGSKDGGHADALVKELGLTGTPFMSVYNGCATGGSSLLAAANAIEAGMPTSPSLSGSTSTSVAPSQPIRPSTGSASGMARTG